MHPRRTKDILLRPEDPDSDDDHALDDLTVPGGRFTSPWRKLLSS